MVDDGLVIGSIMCVVFVVVCVCYLVSLICVVFVVVLYSLVELKGLVDDVVCFSVLFEFCVVG